MMASHPIGAGKSGSVSMATVPAVASYTFFSPADTMATSVPADRLLRAKKQGAAPAIPPTTRQAPERWISMMSRP